MIRLVLAANDPGFLGAELKRETWPWQAYWSTPIGYESRGIQIAREVATALGMSGVAVGDTLVIDLSTMRSRCRD
jgi:hypothetical protein